MSKTTKPSRTTEISTQIVVTAPNSQDAQMGQQLTEQYHRATGAIREILIFGSMMVQMKDTLSTRGQGTGNGIKGDGLKGWLECYAPDISRPTAYRFMELAEGLQKRFETTDTVFLLSTPVEDLSDAEQAKRKEIDELIEGKSQRQLYFDFGLNEKKAELTESQIVKVIRSKSPAQKESELRTALCLKFDAVYKTFGTKEWQILTDDMLRGTVELFEEFATDVRAYLAIPKAERVARKIKALTDK